MSKMNIHTENDPEKLWKNGSKPWDNWDNKSIKHPEEHPIKDEEEKKTFSFFSHFKIQAIVAILIFGLVFASTKISNPTFDQAQAWVKNQLSKSMNFVAIANWYENTFEGSPSFIPNFGSKSEQALAKKNEGKEVVNPIENGVLLHTFAELLNGIEIVGDSKANVFAAEKGRVIHVREQQDSVIIQHSDNRLSIYTKLGEVNVAVNDWVEAGDVIGNLAPVSGEDYSILFFSVKQNDQYVDPLDVIPVE